MESHWREFDKINDAHEFILKQIHKIEKNKSQRIVGKKPAQYVVECGNCGRMTQLSFSGVNTRKKCFICFDCLAKE